MYSNSDDIIGLIPEQVVIELSCDTAPYDTLNTDALEKAILQADREIDSYLARRVPVPLTEVPGLIRNLSAKMAIRFLHVRKHIYSEIWEKEYERAIFILASIYDGKMKIGQDEGSTPSVIERRNSLIDAPEKIYTPDFWKTF